MKRLAAMLATILAAGLGLTAALGAQAGEADAPAPAVYDVVIRTTSGSFRLEIHRDWAPHEADRFHTLVAQGYYTGNAFFRVLRGFVAQWGLSPDPRASAAWARRPIPDDPPKMSNLAGTISFAASGPHSRTTEVFINLGNNSRLDKQGFAPFGRVVAGWETVAGLEAGYGEQPSQKLILAQGAAYLTRAFPRLDVIYAATLAPAAAQP